MARTSLAVQEVTRAGLAPAYTAANVDGHSINNTGRMFLHVKNTNAVPTTCTILFGKTIDGQDTEAGREVIVPATTGDRMIGPFPTDDYNQPSGAVFVNFTAITDVTCAAVTV